MHVSKPELVNALATVLADSVALSYKLQGAHWNVIGADFHQNHEFFAMIYADVDGSIDPTAENIRKLGAPAPSNLSDFGRLTNIAESMPGSSFQELLKDCYEALEIAIVGVNLAFDIANSSREQGIADFLAGRDDMLKKWRWQMLSSLDAKYGF
jgi:starvation-inducible DNA-binding protein